MDLYQIRYFLTISELGSFTQAAERLFVSQPSLSAGIKKLERELGVKLFDRGGRGVMLTPAGQFFLKKAQSILESYQSTLDELKDFQEKPILKLGVLHTIQSCVVTRFVRDFRNKYTNVIIEIYNGYFEDLQEQIDRGELDFAMTWLKDRKDSQNSIELFHQPLLLAVPEKHRFAKQRRVNLKDLDGQPYIERIHCEFWRECPQMFENIGIRPHVIYSADREEWVISLIQTGLGVSIMPVWKDLLNITYIPVAKLALERTIGLTWRKNKDSKLSDCFQTFASDYNWQV
ncbi:MAG: LysR family transcriptional regulator [Cyanobacteria bacterium SID2]|nr:LysR family transcriptional regulator [Cyanobacteria bacterium SID2]MBP0003226.1 LysR family transcriptional regulator [Cyanobacteria bacterium SBC]